MQTRPSVGCWDLQIIGDIGTLLFSFVAAKYAMNMSMSSEHLEIQCQRAPTCCGMLSVEPLNEFSNVEPLALDFLAKMLSLREDQQVVADPSPDLTGEEKAVVWWALGVAGVGVGGVMGWASLSMVGLGTMNGVRGHAASLASETTPNHLPRHRWVEE
eukprot:Skav227278  [mRNA]  locus=scaffold3073:22109:29174:- [translate_table: standard]